MGVCKNQIHHKKIVKYVQRYLVENGYEDVRADLPKSTRPEKINGTEKKERIAPDVTAQKYGLNIYEVETDDSILDRHTGERWKFFAASARECMGSFWVVVPRGSGDSAEQRLKELGILANILEI